MAREKKRLKILLFEPDDNACGRLHGVLSKIDAWTPEIERAASLEAALKALKRNTHDVCLATSRASELSLRKLLKSATENGHQTPIILIARQKADESICKRMLETGAADYLAGNRIGEALLEQSIRHAIERTRILKAQRESEEKLRVLSEQSLLGVFITKDGRVVFANDVVSKITGYSREEILGAGGEGFLGIVHPEDRAFVCDQARRKKVGDPGAVPRYDVRIITKDGDTKWLSLHSRTIQYNGGNAVEAVILDVTDHKRAEAELKESEARYRLLAGNVSDIIWTTDLNLRLTYVSPSVTRMRGVTYEEAISETIEEILTPASLELAMKLLAEELALEQKKPKDLSRSRAVELEHKCKDGSTVWAEVKVTFLRDDSGQPVGILGITRDISERKRAEEALQERERFLSNIFASIQDGISILDADLTILRTNRIVEQWQPHALPLPGKKCYEAYHGRTSPCEVCPTLQTLKTGQSANEVVPKHAANRKHVGWLDIYTFPLIDTATGTLYGVIEYVRDITERKRAEEALRESEERHRTLVENATDIICTIDVRTGIIANVNSFSERILGYPVENVLNKLNFLDLVHPDDREKVVKRLRDLARDGSRIPNFPLRLKKADDTYIHVEVNGAITYDGKGNPEAFIGVIRDVTEHKRAEDALRGSEERYRTLVNNSLTGICIVQDGRFKFVNDQLTEMSGYTREELLELPFLGLVHPEDQGFSASLAEERIAGQPPTVPHHYRALRKDGTVRWIETFGTLTEYDSRPAALVHLIDITERKQAEERLRASEEKYRTVLDTIEDGFYETDLAGNFTFFNDTIQKVLGHSKEELLGMNYRKYVDEENAKILYQSFNTVYRTGQMNKGFVCYVKEKDGTPRPKEFSVVLVRDNNGKPTGFRGVVRDISERKRAEELLRASEEKYRTLLDTIEDGFYETDLAGNFIFFNNTIVKLLGYSKEELLGMNYRQYCDEHDRKIIYESFNSIYRTGQMKKGFVCTVTCKDGSRRPVEFSVFLVRDDQGKPIGFRGVVRDISERKRAEELLRSSEEKYRTLFEESKDVIYISTPDGRLLDINPAGVDLLGYSCKEELLRIDISRDLYMNAADRKAYQEAVAKRGFVRDYELVFKRKDGQPVNILLTSSAVRDAEGQIVAYRGIMRDMTERKQLEQQLFQAQKMESIGTLAGGVAHDFNNILGGILGYASFMKTKLEKTHTF
ncbi:MAG: PAS domain S-box protein, partial [Candidatus Abyssobacteria bacterium SURF_17]